MSTLTLATAEDRPRLTAMIAQFHAWGGLTTHEADREEALDLLFSGAVQAAAWLIGPRRSPVGYIVVSFGFSLELGGRDAIIDEFFIRENVRGRGMGSQCLQALLPELKSMGIKAVHMEVDHDNPKAQKLYARLGFARRDTYFLMSRKL